MSWIYIIAVIIFAIFSNVNKAAKNKPKGTTRNGMPTFGGGGEERPLRRTKRSEDHERSDSGFPTPTTTSPRPSMSEQSGEYDATPAFPEPAYTPTPNYVSGEGMSLEQPAETGGIEARLERMHRDLARRQADFDDIDSSDGTNARTKKNKNSTVSSTVQSSFVDNRNDLRNGLIWAEILGPPRSRKPHSTRR